MMFASSKRSPAGESDAELVERARSGESAAQAALYRRHASYIAGTVYRILGQDDDLEDIVQETFLEGLRSIASLSDPARIRSFLVTIAVRRIHRRLAGRYRVRGLFRRLFGIAPRVSDPAACEDVHDLYRALQHISPHQRVAWVLHHVEGHTLPEVSEQCGVSLATVKRWLRKVDEKLEARHASS